MRVPRSQRRARRRSVPRVHRPGSQRQTQRGPKRLPRRRTAGGLSCFAPTHLACARPRGCGDCRARLRGRDASQRPGRSDNSPVVEVEPGSTDVPSTGGSDQILALVASGAALLVAIGGAGYAHSTGLASPASPATQSRWTRTKRRSSQARECRFARHAAAGAESLAAPAPRPKRAPREGRLRRPLVVLSRRLADRPVRRSLGGRKRERRHIPLRNRGSAGLARWRSAAGRVRTASVHHGRRRLLS